MYNIIKAGCPSGYAYVKDHYGNKCFYGPIKECQQYIKYMENEYRRILKIYQRAGDIQ